MSTLSELRCSYLAGVLLICGAGCGVAGDDDDSAATTSYNANPNFEHPATWLYSHFETAEEAELAFVLRALEEDLLSSVNFDSDELIERSPSLAPLTETELAELKRPAADPTACQAVSLASHSVHPVSRHALAALQSDQTGGDPSTPERHQRSFDDNSEQCWGSQDCQNLIASDEMTRVNPLFTIELTEELRYRWVELSLPAPSTTPLGQQPQAKGEPRTAILMRSWLPERAANTDNTAAFEQGYTLGAWFPGSNAEGHSTLRYTASWTQTVLPVPLDDSTIRQLTRGAINDAYQAQEEWLNTMP
ncbi:MAG: hypothetical protein CMP23_15010 [Rickettsiales bacterium]|nr:hypothetical protein [Rickettsiales bacterium]